MVNRTRFNFQTFLYFLLFSAVATQGCPKGWKDYDNSCYLLVMRKMNWRDSRANCLAYGGDMVSILDSSEVGFIYQQTSAIKNSRFWIGLIRTNKTSDPKEGWIWSDGNNFTNLLQWGPDEPNNDQDNEHCAQILPRKSWWNDNDCAREYASICKRKKGNFHTLFLHNTEFNILYACNTCLRQMLRHAFLPTSFN